MTFKEPVVECRDALMGPLPSPSLLPAVEDKPAVEKTLETFIALNFEAVTGIPILAVFPSRAMVSEPDIVALDRLGRVHLVEVKMRKILGGDVEQAKQYMLRYPFADRFDLFERVSQDDRVARTAAMLAGVVCGDDATKEGWNLLRRLHGHDLELDTYLRSHFGSNSTKNAYDHLQPQEAERVRVATLLSHARLRACGLSNGLESAVQRVFDSALSRLTSTPSLLAHPEPSEVPWPRRPLVLWVIAPEISDDAISSIDTLRRRGVDARAARVNLRRSTVSDDKGERGWVVRIEREDAPVRDRCEKETFEWLATTGNTAGSVDVETILYNEPAPSARGQAAGRKITVNFPVINLRSDGDTTTFDWMGGDWEQTTATRVGVARGDLRRILECWAGRALAYDWSAECASVEWLAPRLTPHRRNADVKEGRVGVNLSKHWVPGVFVGALLNGWDHCLAAADVAKGIDVGCILDIDQAQLTDRVSGRRSIKQELTPAFDALVRSLSEDTQLLSEGWTIHAATDQTTPNPNYWHPIVIRRPLVDVTDGRLDAATDYQKYLAALIRAMGAIVRRTQTTELARLLAPKVKSPQ